MFIFDFVMFEIGLLMVVDVIFDVVVVSVVVVVVCNVLFFCVSVVNCVCIIVLFVDVICGVCVENEVSWFCISGFEVGNWLIFCIVIV